MKSEVTSKRVAAIAGKILKGLGTATDYRIVYIQGGKIVDGIAVYVPVCNAGELKALAASGLTQAPNKATEKRIRQADAILEKSLSRFPVREQIKRMKTASRSLRKNLK